MTICDFYVEPINTDIILLNMIGTCRFSLSEITGRQFLFPYKSTLYWGACCAILNISVYLVRQSQIICVFYYVLYNGFLDWKLMVSTCWCARSENIRQCPWTYSMCTMFQIQSILYFLITGFENSAVRRYIKRTENVSFKDSAPSQNQLLLIVVFLWSEFADVEYTSQSRKYILITTFTMYN